VEAELFVITEGIIEGNPLYCKCLWLCGTPEI